MLDGLYQSLICFFMGYLLFAPANFVTSNGLNVNDRPRMGAYIACAVIMVINIYILMNTYRWDWLMLGVVALSILLVWFWTGVWSTSKTYASTFYRAAPEVFSQLTFWVLTLLIIIACLLPRFFIKAVQKVYMPRDIDIIREQVRLGKFDYLERAEADVSAIKISSTFSSDLSGTAKHPKRDSTPIPDDERPIYPPSVAPTATTRNPRSQNGSDGTNYTGHRSSLDRPTRPHSFDRPRPSFDRMRGSMDKIRPSYEASNDFTSAALLTRVESSHTQSPSPWTPHSSSALR